jgi:hypothetical protein
MPYHTEIAAFREQILDADGDIEPISQAVIFLYSFLLKKNNRLTS